ncbi:hypothetical protein B0H13DRAFT_1868179 [Mycena leptocephala]|nr:hypothetical protein B0H13DRAFT_1868179 [Mycena leptocephala]
MPASAKTVSSLSKAKLLSAAATFHFDATGSVNDLRARLKAHMAANKLLLWPIPTTHPFLLAGNARNVLEPGPVFLICVGELLSTQCIEASVISALYVPGNSSRIPQFLPGESLAFDAIWNSNRNHVLRFEPSQNNFSMRFNIRVIITSFDSHHLGVQTARKGSTGARSLDSETVPTPPRPALNFDFLRIMTPLLPDKWEYS